MSFNETVSFGVSFNETVAVGASFNETVAIGASFNETVAIGASFNETVAVGASFSETVAIGASFNETVSPGASFNETVAVGASFNETVAIGASFSETVAIGGDETVGAAVGAAGDHATSPFSAAACDEVAACAWPASARDGRTGALGEAFPTAHATAKPVSAPREQRGDWRRQQPQTGPQPQRQRQRRPYGSSRAEPLFRSPRPAKPGEGQGEGHPPRYETQHTTTAIPFVVAEIVPPVPSPREAGRGLG